MSNSYGVNTKYLTIIQNTNRVLKSKNSKIIFGIIIKINKLKCILVGLKYLKII